MLKFIHAAITTLIMLAALAAVILIGIEIVSAIAEALF